jgi:hypothetical protein
MSPEMPADFEGVPVMLAVETEDGQQLTSRCDRPPGSWRQVPFSEVEHPAKLRDCLGVGFDVEPRGMHCAGGPARRTGRGGRAPRAIASGQDKVRQLSDAVADEEKQP